MNKEDFNIKVYTLCDGLKYSKLRKRKIDLKECIEDFKNHLINTQKHDIKIVIGGRVNTRSYDYPVRTEAILLIGIIHKNIINIYVCSNIVNAKASFARIGTSLISCCAPPIFNMYVDIYNLFDNRTSQTTKLDAKIHIYGYFLNLIKDNNENY